MLVLRRCRVFHCRQKGENLSICGLWWCLCVSPASNSPPGRLDDRNEERHALVACDHSTNQHHHRHHSVIILVVELSLGNRQSERLNAVTILPPRIRAGSGTWILKIFFASDVRDRSFCGATARHWYAILLRPNTKPSQIRHHGVLWGNSWTLTTKLSVTKNSFPSLTTLECFYISVLSPKNRLVTTTISLNLHSFSKSL